MNQNLLKDKLVETVESGLVVSAISKHTGIDYVMLSKFKNGHIWLNPSDAEKLNRYLSAVVIPTEI